MTNLGLGDSARRRARLLAWARAPREGRAFNALAWGYALTMAAVLQLSGVRPNHLPWWVRFGAVVGCWLAAYALAVETVTWWRGRTARSRS